MKDFDRHRAFLESEPAEDTSLESRLGKAFLEFRIGRAFIRRKGFPELGHLEVPGHSRQPVEMVGMGVGQDHVVELFDAAAPEKRRDDMLAGVETRVRHSSAVDQHFFPAREFDQDGISLSDIDEGQPEGGRKTGPEGVSDKRDEEDGEEEGRQQLLPFETGPEKKEQEKKKISENDRRWRSGEAIGEPGNGIQ